jgi:hypothetical protein
MLRHRTLITSMQVKPHVFFRTYLDEAGTAGSGLCACDFEAVRSMLSGSSRERETMAALVMRSVWLCKRLLCVPCASRCGGCMRRRDA